MRPSARLRKLHELRNRAAKMSGQKKATAPIFREMTQLVADQLRYEDRQEKRARRARA